MGNFEQLPLRDIHLPDAVSWWPLAAGWWVLLVLILLVGGGVWWWVKQSTWRRQRRKLLRLARSELDRIETAYNSSEDTGVVLVELSVLVRRIAMSLFDREQVAGLCGREWRSWLQRTDTDQNLNEQTLSLLTQGPYERVVTADVPSLLTGLRCWLDSLPRREIGHDSL